MKKTSIYILALLLLLTVTLPGYETFAEENLDKGVLELFLNKLATISEEDREL